MESSEPHSFALNEGVTIKSENDIAEDGNASYIDIKPDSSYLAEETEAEYNYVDTHNNQFDGITIKTEQTEDEYQISNTTEHGDSNFESLLAKVEGRDSCSSLTIEPTVEATAIDAGDQVYQTDDTEADRTSNTTKHGDSNFESLLAKVEGRDSCSSLTIEPTVEATAIDAGDQVYQTDDTEADRTSNTTKHGDSNFESLLVKVEGRDSCSSEPRVVSMAINAADPVCQTNDTEADLTDSYFCPTAVKIEPLDPDFHEDGNKTCDGYIGNDNALAPWDSNSGGTRPDSSSCNSGTSIIQGQEGQFPPAEGDLYEPGKSSNHGDSADWQASPTGKAPFTCIDCGKQFLYRSNLKQHRLTHTGEKPHVCLDCGKQFSRLEYLKQHQVIHSGEKPYACSDCGKKFTYPNNLKQHRLIHTGEKPFSCTVCGKCFGQKYTLKQHQLTHSGEKPFSCAVCNKQFTQMGNLRQHAVTHTGEKPFYCADCGKSFTLKSYLKQHQVTHSNERPYVCGVCGKGFARRIYLKTHATTHSDEKP